MRNNYLHLLFLILSTTFCYSQDPGLCRGLVDYIKIENVSDIPTVTENGDDTITLTFPQQYISEIFADYMIFDFYQTFPSGSEILQKYYTVVYDSNDLINDIFDQVPATIISVDNPYLYTPLTQSIIDFLDGKVFRYSKYCSDINEFGEFCSDNEVTLPDDFNIFLTFTYDTEDDIIEMENNGFSSCDIDFEVGLRGGDQMGYLQPWEIELASTTEDPSCDYAEDFLHNVIGIGCSDGHYGDLDVAINSVENTITFGRNTPIFTVDYITLEFHSLSLEDSPFRDIKLLTSTENPFINFSNLDSGNYEIEAFDSTGKRIIERQQYSNNSLRKDLWASGLYFLKLSHHSDSQVFKLLIP